MFTINGIETNYNNLFIYNAAGDILYTTHRPYDMNIIIDGVTVRNARKINYSKMDIFEAKTSGKDDFLYTRNGKDLYIPNTIFEVVKSYEKLHFEHDGEKDYKTIYEIKLHCNVTRWNKHMEKVADLAPNQELKTYDENGIFSNKYSKHHNTYHVSTHFKTGETIVFKKWLTLDTLESLEVESDYYTRTEKDSERENREKIADVINSCLYSNKTISHYEVARLLEKLNITIKE